MRPSTAEALDPPLALTPRPRVAVIIAVCNGQADLERTLASVDAQSFPHHVFVVDDGSEPPVALNLSAFRQRVDLRRLPANWGVVAARNDALARIFAAGYDYCAIQDAGDTDRPARLSAQVAFLDAHPEIAAVGGWAQFNDLRGRPLFVFRAPATPRAVRRRQRYGMAFVHPSCMFRTAALKLVGVYREGYPAAEDYELLFRLGCRFDLSNIPEILIDKEENPKGESVGKRRVGVRARMKVQRENFSARDVHAYLGILYSVALLIVPYSLLLRVKQVLRSVR
jgi:glycosyltransferase involved in cell wall biosynthesis